METDKALLADKKYSVIYADPPWAFRAYSENGLSRSVENHYHTMTAGDIEALPVESIAEKDCALFLWATFPTLPQALATIAAWGFTYKTVGFAWVKQNRKSDGLFWGLGHWTRSNAEVCLLATRGHPKRVSAGVHSVVVSHVGKHSEKPAEVRERIVRLMGDLPRVELFARQTVEGWDAWGDEVARDISLEQNAAPHEAGEGGK